MSRWERVPDVPQYVDPLDALGMKPPACEDADHKPPKTRRALPPGVYEHECPSCHKLTTMLVGRSG